MARILLLIFTASLSLPLASARTPEDCVGDLKAKQVQRDISRIFALLGKAIGDAGREQTRFMIQERFADVQITPLLRGEISLDFNEYLGQGRERRVSFVMDAKGGTRVRVQASRNANHSRWDESRLTVDVARLTGRELEIRGTTSFEGTTILMVVSASLHDNAFTAFELTLSQGESKRTERFTVIRSDSSRFKPVHAAPFPSRT